MNEQTVLSVDCCSASKLVLLRCCCSNSLVFNANHNFPISYYYNTSTVVVQLGDKDGVKKEGREKNTSHLKRATTEN